MDFLTILGTTVLVFVIERVLHAVWDKLFGKKKRIRERFNHSLWCSFFSAFDEVLAFLIRLRYFLIVGRSSKNIKSEAIIKNIIKIIIPLLFNENVTAELFDGVPLPDCLFSKARKRIKITSQSIFSLPQLCKFVNPKEG